MATATKTKAPEPAPRGAPENTENTTTELTTKKPAGVPDFSFIPQDEIEKYAGKGVSKEQSDNLIPLIYKLQSQSPQVNVRNPAYIDGATPGAIWLREHPEPIVSGDEGALFQPCDFKKVVIEWIPRDDGGGFVARHNEMPKDAIKTVDPKNPNKVSWSSPRNTQYVETREHVGLIHDGGQRLPYVVPMSGADHKVSKGWMTYMNSLRTPTGKTIPPFMGLYRLKTKYRTNTQGEWFGWEVRPEGFIDNNEDFKLGAALYEAYASGAKEASAPEMGAHAADINDGGGFDDGKPSPI